MRDHCRGLVLTNGLLLTWLYAGFWTSPALSSDNLTIARDGKTQYVVVRAEQATDLEKLAARELTNFLSRVTGASFPVVTESALSGNAPGVYVGWTGYMAANGIEGAKLGEEEWIIRSVGDTLILTGGRPRGTLYAVYEFLENQVGCHWLDRNTEVIPARPTLVLPALQIQGKPTFWGREIFTAYGLAMPTDDMQERQSMFVRRNKEHRPPTGAPGPSHTFSLYVKASKWFDSHPEYFSLNAQGQRVPGENTVGPGQLCLTHPDVRRIVLEQLRTFVAADRAKAAKSGRLPPRIYDISQDDAYFGHCKCANCQAIVAREGGESGPVIDFINAIAEGIEEDYPDILVQTFAYNLTKTPPRTLKPRRNVIVRWCDAYDSCDVVRPLSHPSNARNYEQLMGWGKIAPRLAVWDYWTSFCYYRFPTPYCVVQCIGPDLKLFADMHAETLLAESHEQREAGENFIALKHWLAYQLMVNPYQPVEPLIRIFMDGYYGAAAPQMNAYLKYLAARIDREAHWLRVHTDPHNLEYLDVSFFVTSEKLFEEAESLVRPGSLEALHVQRERSIVDGALLYLWPWLERKLTPEAGMPFDHETVIRRYETNCQAQLEAFYSEKAQAWREEGYIYPAVHLHVSGANHPLAALFRDPKLPEQFRELPSRDVADFNRLTFSPYSPLQNFVGDKEAAGEMAVSFAGDNEAHTKPLSFGVTGGATITLEPERIPQDEKYHLFKIGRINVKPGTTVWAYAEGRLGVNVDRLFVPDAKDIQVNDWDAYISLKVKGPAYVKGSTEANGIWVDRVLLVKSRNMETE